MIYKLFFIYLEKIYVSKNYIYTQNWLGICNKTTHIYKLCLTLKNETAKNRRKKIINLQAVFYQINADNYNELRHKDIR